MSTNTKQVLDAACPFTESNELVSYMVSMIKVFEQELMTKMGFMRNRMDTLGNVTEGCEGYHYQMCSDIGKLGMEIDIGQAHIFVMTGSLVIVLNSQCGLALEW